MLDPDPAQRADNVEANMRALALADELGVLCCVNIAGSFHPTRWDGPHPLTLSEEAFELTVQNVRRIIDAVKPKQARYTLETMPWVIPDNPYSYLRLIEAIDRPMFGAHLDPVNLQSTGLAFLCCNWTSRKTGSHCCLLMGLLLSPSLGK